MKNITINNRAATIYKMGYRSWFGYYKDEYGITYHGETKAELLNNMGYNPKPRKQYKPRKEIPPTDLYRKLNTKSNEIGEENDCTVIALAIALNIQYEDAHAALELAGRKTMSGASWYTLFKAIDILDYKLDEVRKPEEIKTIKKAEEYFKEKGHYILDTSKHVAAMIDGVVHDWSRGRALRVKRIFKVEKIG